MELAAVVQTGRHGESGPDRRVWLAVAAAACGGGSSSGNGDSSGTPGGQTGGTGSTGGGGDDDGDGADASIGSTGSGGTPGTDGGGSNGTSGDGGTSADAGPISVGTIVTPGDAGNADLHLEVHADQNQRAISPLVYGSNDTSDVTDSRIGMLRLGGNRLTAYNWETNASNAGSDYSYQNDGLLEASNTPGQTITIRWTARSRSARPRSSRSRSSITSPPTRTGAAISAIRRIT